MALINSEYKHMKYEFKSVMNFRAIWRLYKARTRYMLSANTRLRFLSLVIVTCLIILLWLGYLYGDYSGLGYAGAVMIFSAMVIISMIRNLSSKDEMTLLMKNGRLTETYQGMESSLKIEGIKNIIVYEEMVVIDFEGRKKPTVLDCENLVTGRQEDLVRDLKVIQESL